ncbi:MAG: helix-turn-helix transcriptional regulator [Bacteroidota bacterium]
MESELYFKTIAWWIRYLRLLRGMTQLELAVKCGYQNSFMCGLECGRNMEIGTILKIACALGVECWQILKFEKTLEELIPLVREMERALKKKNHEKRYGTKKKRKRRI